MFVESVPWRRCPHVLDDERAQVVLYRRATSKTLIRLPGDVLPQRFLLGLLLPNVGPMKHPDDVAQLRVEERVEVGGLACMRWRAYKRSLRASLDAFA